MKKLIRSLIKFAMKINPRSVTIFNPRIYILYPFFKLTFGFPNIFYKVKDPRTRRLNVNKLLITENTEYFEDYWKIFDKYMQNPKKEKAITRKGFLSRMAIINHSNQTEMRELTESEIKNISEFFDPWINIVKEYFRSPVSVLNIRSWRDHKGAKYNNHVDGLPYGTMKIMLYRGENTIDKGTFYININKNKSIPIIGNNTIFIFDQNHLSHHVMPSKEGDRDCIELVLIADKRERRVSAGNVAEWPVNPFSNWSLKANKIIRFNKRFYIGA